MSSDAKQTLRELTPSELRSVAGGGDHGDHDHGHDHDHGDWDDHRRRHRHWGSGCDD
jgi:hypothetical protein